MLAPPSIRPTAPTNASMAALSKPFGRPTLIKRSSTLKRSIDDTSSMDASSSPAKRSRVTFDTDVEILPADEDQKDPLVVKEEVYRAVQRRKVGDDELYENIRSLFVALPDKDNAPDERALKIYIQAFLAHVSILNRDCNSLVHTIINSEWVGRDDMYFTLFVKFLGNLAAAHNGYVNKIMQVLVNLLGPQKTRRISGSKPVRQSKIHRRILQTIQYITQLVPTASGVLLERITTKLDFDFQVSAERMTYIKNFMELIQYVPELNSEVLTSILRQLIKLDTAIQTDLDEEEEDLEDEIMQHMSASQTLAMEASQAMLRSPWSAEDDDLSTSDESDMEEDEELDPEAARRKKLKEDVKQVDMIMDMLFQHYSKLTTSTALQTRHNAIEQLVAQFHHLILPTYRSRHPQFLIFHFAQSDPIIVDRFVTSCVAILIDKRKPQVLRHAAAAYFSGFVGRGAHVSPSVVQDCLDLLCDQLNMLRKAYEPTCRSPDLKRYGDFYSIFQAIMYIFCFRWRDIGSATSDIDEDYDYDDDDDDNNNNNNDNGKGIEEYHFSDILRDTIHSAIYSPLNPLRVCTPAIVEQFAKISMILQFLYVYPKLEENKRIRVTTSWRAAVSDSVIGHAERDLSWVGENGMLEGYFPYDPYHLPVSRHWIQGDYVEWKGLPGEVDDGSDSDSDSDDDIDDDDEEEEEAELHEDETDSDLGRPS